MKRTLSLIACTMILANSTFALSTTVAQPTTFTTTTSTNPDLAKINKLASLKDKIIEYLKKDFDTRSSVVKDTQTIQLLKEKFNQFIENVGYTIDTVQYQAVYDETMTYSKVLGMLKEDFKAYKSIRKDLLAMQNWSNPYTVSEDVVKTVEDYTLAFQKDYIDYLEKNLFYDMLQYDGVSENWTMNFDLNSSYGHINLSLSGYDSKINLEDFSQEMNMKIYVTFDWKDIYGEDNGYSGNVYSDINMKVFGNIVYLTLNDAKVDISWLTNAQLLEVNTVLKSLKGKTVKIDKSQTYMYPTSYSSTSTITSAEVVSWLKKVLEILKENSLLTPYKVSGNKYFVYFNKATIEKLKALFPQPDYESGYEYDETSAMNKEIMLAENFYYQSDKWIVLDTNDISSTWSFIFSNEDNWFQIKGNVEGKGYSTWNEFTFLHNRNKFSLSLKMSDEVDMHILWENKKLDAYIRVPIFEAWLSWDCSRENVDLDITFNKNSIWYYKMTFDGEKAAYDIKLDLDSLKNLTPDLEWFLIKLTWNANISTWAVTITEPTNAVDINEVLSGSTIF